MVAIGCRSCIHIAVSYSIVWISGNIYSTVDGHLGDSSFIHNESVLPSVSYMCLLVNTMYAFLLNKDLSRIADSASEYG